MKHVSELYEQLVSSGQVYSIRRYNLRKFCRSFELPPCGVSFWQLDDLNWDYLGALNHALGNDKFRFRGGENFPRSYWDRVMLGETDRTEFIFLTRDRCHHAPWQQFFERHFSDNCRSFGNVAAVTQQPTQNLAPLFKNGLVADLIHFGAVPSKLPTLADFYLALLFMTSLQGIPDLSRDSVFEAFKTARPQFRADITRISTTQDPVERLDDVLYLISKLNT